MSSEEVEAEAEKNVTILETESAESDEIIRPRDGLQEWIENSYRASTELNILLPLNSKDLFCHSFCSMR